MPSLISNIATLFEIVGYTRFPSDLADQKPRKGLPVPHDAERKRKMQSNKETGKVANGWNSVTRISKGVLTFKDEIFD